MKTLKIQPYSGIDIPTVELNEFDKIDIIDQDFEEISKIVSKEQFLEDWAEKTDNGNYEITQYLVPYTDDDYYNEMGMDGIAEYIEIEDRILKIYLAMER